MIAFFGCDAVKFNVKFDDSALIDCSRFDQTFSITYLKERQYDGLLLPYYQLIAQKMSAKGEIIHL